MRAGLRLLGFKPLGQLLDYHQLRSSTFMYPDEATRPGSTTAFIALHEALRRRGRSVWHLDLGSGTQDLRSRVLSAPIWCCTAGSHSTEMRESWGMEATPPLCWCLLAV